MWISTRPDRLLCGFCYQAAQVLAELPELEPDRLLLEPEPRGTGPALAWAALAALQLHPRAVMVSLHADAIVVLKITDWLGAHFYLCKSCTDRDLRFAGDPS